MDVAVLYFGVLLCDACFGPVYGPPSMLCPTAGIGLVLVGRKGSCSEDKQISYNG